MVPRSRTKEQTKYSIVISPFPEQDNWQVLKDYVRTVCANVYRTDTVRDEHVGSNHGWVTIRGWEDSLSVFEIFRQSGWRSTPVHLQLLQTTDGQQPKFIKTNCIQPQCSFCCSRSSSAIADTVPVSFPSSSYSPVTALPWDTTTASDALYSATGPLLPHYLQDNAHPVVNGAHGVVPLQPSRRIHVSGLKDGLSEQELARLFKSAGQIRDLKVSRRWAWIEYDTSREASAAVQKFNHETFKGFNLRVKLDENRESVASGNQAESGATERQTDVYAGGRATPVIVNGSTMARPQHRF